MTTVYITLQRQMHGAGRRGRHNTTHYGRGRAQIGTDRTETLSLTLLRSASRGRLRFIRGWVIFSIARPKAGTSADKATPKSTRRRHVIPSNC